MASNLHTRRNTYTQIVAKSVENYRTIYNCFSGSCHQCQIQLQYSTILIQKTSNYTQSVVSTKNYFPVSSFKLALTFLCYSLYFILYLNWFLKRSYILMTQLHSNLILYIFSHKQWYCRYCLVLYLNAS